MKIIYFISNLLLGQSVTGNEKFNAYVIAKLPQLKSLDGTEITKSMQIVATQKVKELEVRTRYIRVK